MVDIRRKTALARQMRKVLTTPEWLLWERLKHRTEGLIFKRQFAIGPYILDFYCFKARLAVEVDGTLHSLDDRAEKDETRDAWLHSQGLEVCRLAAADVYRDADGVADGVRLLALERAARFSKI